MTTAATVPRVGDLVAEKYRVLRVIADGGMGLVFEAHHELLGKSVALKFPLPELAQVPSVAERFLSEARLCARIENEHVVRILDAARLNGLPYIVMEFLKGTTLSGLLGRRWDRARAAAFARQLLDGLGAVHALGVVHRDVKPDNVLVVQSTRGSVLKLVDFGIAKDSIPRETIKHLTRAGVMLGTPAYMAPEQIRDPLHADLRADLYSVGILLFEMLSGSSPFTGRTVQELADEALVGKLRSLLDLAPDTPQSLVEIVSRATAVEPAKRFQTAAEFGGALAPFASGWLDEPPGDAGQTIADRHAPWTEPGTQGVTTHTERGSTVGQAPVTRTDGAPAPPVATKHLAGVGQGSSARRPRRTRYVRGLAGLALAVAALIVLVAFIAARRKAREESERDALSPTLVSKAPATLEVAPIAPEELPALAETSGEPAQPVPLKPAAANVKRDGASPASPTPESLPATAVASTIRASQDRFRACNPKGRAGHVLVEIRILKDGRVGSATAIQSDAPAPITECVVATCRALRFPPHDGPDQTVRVPITFEATAPATGLPDGGWVAPAWAIPDGDPVRRPPVSD